MWFHCSAAAASLCLLIIAMLPVTRQPCWFCLMMTFCGPIVGWLWLFEGG
jgi:hypothetical protein